MHLHGYYHKYTLHFTFDAGTSRGILRKKDSYFIKLYNPAIPAVFGIGECGPLKGLSPDDRPDLEEQLQQVCQNLAQVSVPDSWPGMEAGDWLDALVGPEWPAIRFGVETALYDLWQGGRLNILPNTWSEAPFRPIPINGLIWMGDKDFMLHQIDEKLKAGYTCLKMKIGAIDFETELTLLSYIRNQFDAHTVTLRVDANGAFAPEEALFKLEALSRLDIHSIEQPIRPGQDESMYRLCRESPVPIALDESLINVKDKRAFLQQIQPQFIIIKPTLLGGLQRSREWITLAEEEGIGWWITSALESNIGLNAIAQLTASLDVTLPQGLGTGQLYRNNIPSPLYIENGFLRYHPNHCWELEALSFT